MAMSQKLLLKNTVVKYISTKQRASRYVHELRKVAKSIPVASMGSTTNTREPSGNFSGNLF